MITIGLIALGTQVSLRPRLSVHVLEGCGFHGPTTHAWFEQVSARSEKHLMLVLGYDEGIDARMPITRSLLSERNNTRAEVSMTLS